MFTHVKEELTDSLDSVTRKLTESNYCYDNEEKALNEIQNHLKTIETETKGMSAVVGSLNDNRNDNFSCNYISSNESPFYEPFEIKEIFKSLEANKMDKKLKKSNNNANKKLITVTDTYEKEVVLLQTEIVKTKKKLKAAETVIEKLNSKISEYDFTNVKLQKKLDEIIGDLNREISVRKSLEEAHQSSQRRLHELELLSNEERKNLQNVSASCISLKNENIQNQCDAEAERQRRIYVENTLKKVNIDKGDLKNKIERIQHEKQSLLEEFERMKIDFEDVNCQLERAKKINNSNLTRDEQLTSALKEAAMHNAKLVVECEENADKVRSVYQSNTREEAIRQQLINEVRLKNQLESKLHQVELILNERNREIEIIRTDNELVLKEKDKMLDEVNQTLDNVVDERKRLDCQLEEIINELKNVELERDKLNLEVGQLRERIASSMQHSIAQQQLERTLAKLTEQKQKLSYENGRLESRVKQLEKEIEENGSARSEAAKLRELVEELKESYNREECQFDIIEREKNRLVSEMKLVKENCERKERDFQAVLQSRDEALKTLKNIQEKNDTLIKKNKQAEINWRDSLESCHTERRQLALQLNQIASAHSHLQSSVDTMQNDLGYRDDKISQLLSERDELKKTLEKLQTERFEFVTKSEEQCRTLNTFKKHMTDVNEDLQLLKREHYDINLLH